MQQKQNENRRRCLCISLLKKNTYTNLILKFEQNVPKSKTHLWNYVRSRFIPDFQSLGNFFDSRCFYVLNWCSTTSTIRWRENVLYILLHISFSNASLIFDDWIICDYGPGSEICKTWEHHHIPNVKKKKKSQKKLWYES